MTTVEKLLKLSLLLLLLLAIIGGVTLQLPPIQEKVKNYIVKKVSSEKQVLAIQEMKGIFPFQLTFHEVYFSSPTLEYAFQEVHVTLNPFSLLLGRISFLNVSLNNGEIFTKKAMGSKKHSNPFRIPIMVHSLTACNMNINGLKGIDLSGNGEFSETFSFHVDLASRQLPNTLFHTIGEGSWQTNEGTLIAHITNCTSLTNLWARGKISLDRFQFEGSLTGDTSFHGNNKLDCLLKVTSDGKIFLSPVKIESPRMNSCFQVGYNLKTQEIVAEGQAGKIPFKLSAILNVTREKIDLSHMEFSSAENFAKGDLLYLFNENDYEGTIEIFPNFGNEGDIEGNIHFSKNEATFHLTSRNLIWKSYSLDSFALAGSWINGKLNFDLKASDLVFLEPEYEVFPTLHFDLQGEMDASRISLLGNTWGLGDSPFTLQAELPVKFTPFPFSLTLEKQSPFALQIQGKGSIDPILAFLENASLIARADIDLNLGIHGTLENPQITGFLTMDHGNVESLTTGAIYRDIHMEMEGDGKEFHILHLSAHDFTHGELVGSGSLIFDYQSGFPFVVNLWAHRYTLIATDPFVANVNAELTFSGNIHQMYLTGQAMIVDGYLSIPNKIPAQIPVLEVTYINQPECSNPRVLYPKKKSFIPVHVDINVEARDNLVIEGRGIISEWRGNVHITGEQNSLAYHGKLKLVQGRFNVVGRSFDLTEGQIQVEGLIPKQIFVDLRGDYELSHLTATIHIRGSLDDTKLSFTSSPPMSTNQILSWILFNQDVNELTPFQACRLANIMVSLSGKYSGPSVFDGIKEGLGIDVFNITHCDIDAADFTFQVGKYISQGTFVGINKSLSGDTDSVTIQTRLYRDFFLEANYGGSLNGLTPNGGKIIFKWYRSY